MPALWNLKKKIITTSCIPPGQCETTTNHKKDLCHFLFHLSLYEPHATVTAPSATPMMPCRGGKLLWKWQQLDNECTKLACWSTRQNGGLRWTKAPHWRSIVWCSFSHLLCVLFSFITVFYCFCSVNSSHLHLRCLDFLFLAWFGLIDVSEHFSSVSPS